MHLRNPSGEGSANHPQLQQGSKRLRSQGHHIEAIGICQAETGLDTNRMPLTFSVANHLNQPVCAAIVSQVACIRYAFV
jgi:hypothetical protein